MNTSAQDNRHGALLLLGAGILWGMVGPLVTVMSQAGATAEQISLLRIGIATLVLIPVIVARQGIRSLVISWRTLLICALLGIVCQGLYNVLHATAIAETGITCAAVLDNTAQIFGFIASVIFFKEIPTAPKVAAIALDIAGCALVVTNGDITSVHFAIFGVTCGLGGALCYAATAIIGRIAGERTNPLVMSVYSYLAATIFLALWTLPHATPFPQNPTVLVCGIVLAIVPTALAYAVYYRGVHLLSETSLVPVLCSTETVVAAVVGILAFHEPLGMWGICGIVLVLASIALMSSKRA